MSQKRHQKENRAQASLRGDDIPDEQLIIDMDRNEQKQNYNEDENLKNDILRRNEDEELRPGSHDENLKQKINQQQGNKQETKRKKSKQFINGLKQKGLYSSKKIQSYYLEGYSWLSKLLFCDILSLLIRRYRSLKGTNLGLEHLPSLEKDLIVDDYLQQTIRQIEQKERINKAKNSDSKLQGDDLIKIIYFDVFKDKVFKILVIFFIEMTAKCSISFVMGNIIGHITGHDLNKAIGETIILGILMLIGMISSNHGNYRASKVSAITRMILANLLYRKLNSLTTYQIEKANVGKIYNIFSMDLNSLEGKIATILKYYITPFTFLYTAVILYVQWEGPLGLTCMVIIIILYPIISCIQHKRIYYAKLNKSNTDKRILLENEFISQIKDIKMNTLEQVYLKQIEQLRYEDLKSNERFQLYLSLERCLISTSQFWISLIFFVFYHDGLKINLGLTVKKMIVTIQLLSFFKGNCLSIFSTSQFNLVSIQGSFNRIASILILQPQQMVQLSEKQTRNHYSFDSISLVNMKNFSAFIEKPQNNKSNAILTNLNIKINRGELIGIYGEIGSGKSQFLKVILGQVPFYTGEISFLGKKELKKTRIRLALTDEELFILPLTIKQNILFGKEYDEELYENVIYSCKLEQEILEMEYADQTEINEKNISQTMKAKICLARSLYSLPDLYLFDNPFSCFDQNEAQEIADSVINHFIFTYQQQLTQSEPSVVLATSQMALLEKSKHIIVLKKGQVQAQGVFEQVKDKIPLSQQSSYKNAIQNSAKREETHIISNVKDLGFKKIQTFRDDPFASKEKVKEQEGIYSIYFKYWYCSSIILIFLLNGCAEGINAYYSRVIALNYEKDYLFRLCGLLCGLEIILYFAKYWWLILKGQSVNKELHYEMIQSFGHAPILFYDHFDQGTVFNRITSDLMLTDSSLHSTLTIILEAISFFFASVITLFILANYFIIPAVIIFVFYLVLFLSMRPIILNIRQLDLMQRSPLFSLTALTIQGRRYIEAFDYENKINEYFQERSNQNIRTNIAFYESLTFLAMYIELLGNIAQIAGLLIIVNLNTSNYAIFTQSLLLMITFNQSQQLVVIKLLELDSILRSFNRVYEMRFLPKEPSRTSPLDQLLQKQKWPQKGEIQYKNVTMKFQKHKYLLQKVNFQIRSNEKIALYFVNESEKNALIYSIFRCEQILASEQIGQCGIFIDGTNIEEIGVSFLRKKISIINSEPFIFNATLRKNLDPENNHQDEVLWTLLEQVNLSNLVKELPNQLNTQLTQASNIFSEGQQILIDVIRVITKAPKIVILDQITTFLDDKTVQTVEECIKKYLYNCTIISIPNTYIINNLSISSINKVWSYDRVMVLKDSQIKEFNDPIYLLAKDPCESTYIDNKTIFAEMIRETGKGELIFSECKKKFLDDSKIL